MDKIKKMLLENKAWSQGKRLRDSKYFQNMAKDQAPDFLWIGCSDSRVDPSDLTNSQPGEMFVHRNIANLVMEDDLNLQSVLQYAVEALKVDHVIVCGHHGCGGVKASMGPVPYPKVEQWIRGIRATFELNLQKINAFPTEQERVNCLVELNVHQQLKVLAANSIIQKSQKERNGYPILHGWIYDLNSGLVRGA
jgi:carbonic anhydrase